MVNCRRAAATLAAEAIFNHAAKAIEIEDIGARLAALEQAQENQKR
jgi:hypothetical protein